MNFAGQRKPLRCITVLVTKIVDELSAFGNFVERHVRKEKECDVQCMLLWSEWLRFSMKAKGRREFPEVIHLEEFNRRIHETFAPDLAWHDYFGPLYVGIKFVK